MDISRQGYLSVHVFVECKDGTDEEFLRESRINASNSILESGIARFDVLRSLDNPQKFVLMEVYRNDESPGEHKKTEHYSTWREKVADSMEVPREAKKYTTVFPTAGYWRTDPSAQEGRRGLPDEETLLSVLVDVQVKPGCEEAFIAATLSNARASQAEAGVSRFDLLRARDDPANFVLHEVYNSARGPAAHKATAHYAPRRIAVRHLCCEEGIVVVEVYPPMEAVEDMMARPRAAAKYQTRFPARVHWHMTEAVAQEPATLLAPASAPNPFEFVSANGIVFGRGAAARLPALLKGLGVSKLLLVTGRTGQARYAPLLQALVDAGLAIAPFVVAKEPGILDLTAGLEVCRAARCDGVVGLGGGAVVDAAKALAALATNPGEIMDYLEVVGKGQPITQKPLPFIAMPTTAGTGSEVTKNAVILAEEHGRKVSIRSPMMLPDVALVDPELGVGAPPQVTAFSGMDCLTQCIEPYVSCCANPFTDALAKEGMLRAARSLRAAYRNGQDLEAREDLAAAATMGGLALANAKLGAVHGFAGYVGGRYPAAPHGAVCAALLPHVFRANAAALAGRCAEEEGEGSSAAHHRRLLARHVEVARIITGNPRADVEEGAAFLEALAADLRVPPLTAFGMAPEHFEEVAAASAASSSMKGNPLVLSQEQLVGILAAACAVPPSFTS